MSIQDDSPDSTLVHVGSNVLIITDNRAASSPVQAELSKKGIQTFITELDSQALGHIPKISPDAVLIHFQKDYKAIAPMVNQLKRSYQDSEFMLIGAFAQHTKISGHGFDSAIFAPAHAMQIIHRVTSMLRLAKMQKEVHLRLQTLRDDFGIPYNPPTPIQDETFRVLFIGKASPDFMRVINALEKSKIEVVAAFTSYSAFDYLHGAAFDAVIMNVQTDIQTSFAMTETMRKNSRLYHVPILYLTSKDFDAHMSSYESGATDVIPYGASGKELSGRVMELANFHKIYKQIKHEFGYLGGAVCIDEASGTYNQSFFMAHMRRLEARKDLETQTPSLMKIQIHNENGKNEGATFKMACHQIGQMMKNLVRMEDIVARLNSQTYIIGFSNRPKDLNIIADRIQAVVNGTNFNNYHSDFEQIKIKLEFDFMNFNQFAQIYDQENPYSRHTTPYSLGSN